MLEKDFEYYLKNQTKLSNDFMDNFIVIQNQTVLKALKSIDEAYKFLLNTDQNGAFLIQEVNMKHSGHTAMVTI